MSNTTELTPKEFLSLGIEHVVECDSPKDSERTYRKKISSKEIYVFVQHYDTNELIICVHEADFVHTLKIERLFKGTIKNMEQLKLICKVIGIPQLNLN